MTRLSRFAAVLALMLAGGADRAAGGDPSAVEAAPASWAPKLLMPDGSAGIEWQSAAGRKVVVQAPELTVRDPKTQAKRSLRVKRKQHEINRSSATFEYELSLNEGGFAITGTGTVMLVRQETPGEDVLLEKISLAFREPVTADLELACGHEVVGEPAEQIGLPERNGVFRVWPMSPELGGAGRFELGNAAKGPVQCSELGMPVVGLKFGGNLAKEGLPGLELAVAADPYCGSYFYARADEACSSTRVSLLTTYLGSVVPLKEEQRTLALEFHRQGTDRTLRCFYRTIPEIEPGAGWTQGIHLAYYDYLSENGQGWFKDLQTLADRIPPANRGLVAACLHGWYDYFQQYAYDHAAGKLLEKWTAFPGTRKVPMSLEEMHKRIRFAKGLGFRVLLYFADGTNSDSGAPQFHKEFVLKDAAGNTFPGWKGPDSLGQPLMMDPGVPELRDWYRGYLKALLDEYSRDVDGFVWDETFYIRPNFISHTRPEPAHADRAMMRLVSELTRMVQERQAVNPDLVFLASDLGATNYSLVAHGTYQDSAMEERHWGPSLFANYRNCLWSCNWFPLGHAKENEIAADKYGLPQGVSNGWGDDCGPNRMPAALLDAVLKRFTRNVEANRERIRFLAP